MNRRALLPQLEALIGENPALRSSSAFTSEHTKWVTKTLSILERALGTNSRYYATFHNFNWQFSCTTVITLLELYRYGDHNGVMGARQQEAYCRQLESAEGLLEAAREELAADPEPEALPPAPEAKYDVFLSYATTDSELAHELKDDLEEEGISCFLAEKDLQVTQQWQDSIRTALLQSRFVLLLITPSSHNRPWLLLEAGAAWALNKPMIPALSHVLPKELVEPISSYQCKKIETISQRAKLIQQIKNA